MSALGQTTSETIWRDLVGATRPSLAGGGTSAHIESFITARWLSVSPYRCTMKVRVVANQSADSALSINFSGRVFRVRLVYSLAISTAHDVDIVILNVFVISTLT